VEDVVDMVFATLQLQYAHVILDGQVQHVLNKLQENVLVIVVEMVNAKLIILVFAIQDTC